METVEEEMDTFEEKSEEIDLDLSASLIEATGDVYASYNSDVSLVGSKHPTEVVESAALRSVLSPNVDIMLDIMKTDFLRSMISSVQEDAIRLCIVKHNTIRGDGTRAGFLVGDGAGMGKGRIISSIIFENFIKNRKKSVWISSSMELFEDAQQNLNDLKTNITVFKYTKELQFDEGVLFCTYSTLAAHVDSFLCLLGLDFDGVLAFDECHRAKNLIPGVSKSKGSLYGAAVDRIQKMLPLARVIYISATGASEPRNMAYMSRIGIWGIDGVFPSRGDFLETIGATDVCGMEVLSLYLKMKGSYIARQLSYKDVKYRLLKIYLDEDFIKMYNSCCEVWRLAYELLDLINSESKNKFGWFWVAHLECFASLCVWTKVKAAVRLCRDYIQRNYCVVFALQRTGEAKLLRNLVNNRIEGYDSTARFSVFEMITRTKAIVNCYLDKPALSDGSEPEEYLLGETNTLNDGTNIKQMFNVLVEKSNALAKCLPQNPIDYIIDELGQEYGVVEITGRRGRVWKENLNNYVYRRRVASSPSLTVIQEEQKLFMDGSCKVAIISEAGSTGISLHSDKRSQNILRRAHITLELPYSGEKAIQQFGRTHRSNQEIAPEYVMLVSGLAGDIRFASGVAKRLENLGALTHGDRRAGSVNDLSEFNIINDIGNNGVKSFVKILCGKDNPKFEPPNESFFIDSRCHLQKVGFLEVADASYRLTGKSLVSKFLNRILGIPVVLQNQIFDYVDQIINDEMTSNKEKCNMRISELSSREITDRVIIREYLFGIEPVVIESFTADKGLDWNSALGYLSLDSGGRQNGFYLFKHGHRVIIVLAILEPGKVKYTTYTPHSGKIHKTFSPSDLLSTTKITRSEAKGFWMSQYNDLCKICWHKWVNGICPKQNGICMYGSRMRKYTVVRGCLLKIWKYLKEKKVPIASVSYGQRKCICAVLSDETLPETIQYLETLASKKSYPPASEVFESTIDKEDSEDMEDESDDNELDLVVQYDYWK